MRIKCSSSNTKACWVFLTKHIMFLLWTKNRFKNKSVFIATKESWPFVFSINLWKATVWQSYLFPVSNLSLQWGINCLGKLFKAFNMVKWPNHRGQANNCLFLAFPSRVPKLISIIPRGMTNKGLCCGYMFFPRMLLN